MENINEKFKEFLKKYPKAILISSLCVLLISTIISGINIFTKKDDRKIEQRLQNMDNDVEGLGHRWKQREASENLKRQRKSITAYEIYNEMKRAEELKETLQILQQRGIKTKEDSIKVIRIYSEIEMIKNKYK